MPVRIQRKRTKGWKMPADTIYVGRPTKWGNPFKIGMNVSGHGVLKDNQQCADVFNEWVKHHLGGACGERPEWAITMKENLEQIKGKNLACWCRLDQPCHADVLLKLAIPVCLPCHVFSAFVFHACS